MSRNSKFLARILRHAPDQIGLQLDPAGWVVIDALLRTLKKAGKPLDRAELLGIVRTNDKQRFTISADGRRIRAAQGHSIQIDLGLTPVGPPAGLYHGTATGNLDAIFREGLKPGRRRQVHLSLDPESARRVGQRHGKPVVLRVEAFTMYAAGHAFFRADNGVWLVDAVPSVYLSFSADPTDVGNTDPHCPGAAR